MPCSNGAWRFLPLPDRAKHKQKKARNYAGLAAFHAIRCLAVPDAESFPLNHLKLTCPYPFDLVFFPNYPIINFSTLNNSSFIGKMVQHFFSES